MWQNIAIGLSIATGIAIAAYAVVKMRVEQDLDWNQPSPLPQLSEDEANRIEDTAW